MANPRPSVAAIVLAAMLCPAVPARAEHRQARPRFHTTNQVVTEVPPFGRAVPLEISTEAGSRVMTKRGGGSYPGLPRPSVRTWLWVAGAVGALLLVVKLSVPST
jgi:hypothetical protein